MKTSKKIVAIIGAGPVGYVLSILLAKQGYTIHLYEKRANPLISEQISEGRSTNFIFGLRAIEALKRAGVYEESLKYSVRLDKIKYIFDNGEFTVYFGGRTQEERSYSINRASIQKILARKVHDYPRISVYYNSHVKNIDLEMGSFQVEDEKGITHSKSSYEQIFGADGTFSVIKNAFIQSPDFSYSIHYSGYGYCELQIPAANEKDCNQSLQGNPSRIQSKFRVDENSFLHWPRKGLDVHLQGMPNYQGDINIGLFLKLKGENSYEQFKNNYETFEQFMHKHYPDSQYLMPNMKEWHANWSFTRLINMKCWPWAKGRFLLIGDSTHTMNPFVGQGINGGLEECALIEDLIVQYEGNWEIVRDRFQNIRKDVADKMNDFADAQFLWLKDKFFLPEVQVSFMISDYLSRNYGDIYQSQIQLIRWTTLDYNKCLSRGAVQQALIKDLRESIPDIMVLVKKNKKDQRVSAIVSKYTDVYDITELQKQKLQDASHTIQQKHFENLYEKYMPTYEKLSPKL